mgnify:CR=1 FL=1
MLASRLFSSFFLFIPIIISMFNSLFFNIFLVHILNFILNWEFLRLINFYKFKKKSNDSMVNNFFLTRCRLSNVDYLSIILLQLTILVFNFNQSYLVIFCSFLLLMLINRSKVKMFGLVYLTMPFIFISSFKDYNELILMLFFLLIIVISTDVGGFILGKTIGGPKIFKKISPKKTWAGFIGGLFFSIFFCYVFFSIKDLKYILIICFLSVICQFGDFLESFLKRSCLVKESSNLIPGHGGFLDRLDGAILLTNFVFVTNFLNFNFYNIIFS